MKVSILGIRHHGCGSARSVRRALAELRPDIVLIEGAPEANEIIPLAAHADIAPPVAMLIYSPEDSKKAVYYPFAEFSPEWQAMRFALENDTPVRFIDLPQAHQLSVVSGQSSVEIPDKEATDDEQLITDEDSKIKNQKSKIRRDPLQFAAEAAGFSDGEVWWENLVETRGESEEDLFADILDLMTALREEAEKEAGDKESERDELREAFMRQEIRRAQTEKFQNIAVVCGAWHAPRLNTELNVKEDAKKLKNLSKIKLAATWIPYTYNRLSFASGYGAGISSPEFYHQIWRKPEKIAANWLARVASLLREQDLDASSASVIEAVRLAESLAVMRGLSAVGLSELFDAVRAVLCFGDDAPLKLIEEKLIVGERMGRVPAETLAVPLQRDLQSAQKCLRFPPEAAQKTVEFDLRKPNDLERSQLLHRLNLLGINWGETQRTGGKGTFKEGWCVQWQPELEIALIEANVWGNTIGVAAVNKVRDIAAKSDKLAELTALVQQSLLSDLPAAIDFLMSQFEAKAAVSTDVPAMMDALPPLADVLRYGNVRKTDASAVGHVVNGLVTRICIGLPNACASLNDEAAEEMFKRLIKTDNAVRLLQNADLLEAWRVSLLKLMDSERFHGLIAGRANRILHEQQELEITEVARNLSLALSTANQTAKAAAWLEGFLQGSGLVLLYNESLLKLLDDWVGELKDDVFVQLLPVLRRTFASFETPERRKIGERIKAGVSGETVQRAESASAEIDAERAQLVLPLLGQLLGLPAGAK